MTSATKEQKTRVIRVLLIEDNPGDARLIQEALSEAKSSRFEVARADRLSTGLKKLAEKNTDVVLLDLSLPDSHGLETFGQLHAKTAGAPIIVLTGLDDEETALKAVGDGAQDYLVKGQVDSVLLERAIRYAIERHRLILHLQEALANIKTLRGLLPICAHCKRIRDDKGYWSQVEIYVKDHSDADFTHGICPECLKTLYPEM